MTFLIESLAACALFSLFVFLMSRDPVKTVFNYPPAIIERCRQLGLVDDSNRPGGPVFYAKKLTALVVFGVPLDCGHYVHHYESESISRKILDFISSLI